ncbi:unnamed protein product [Cuscuta campestris]|uniref:Uncharacterized protein n=1 Tax=Cuscuta campestris TaxID=132261 RepID=A0A484M1M6_9ASTE|nr:unnamed protein product [Cuscuta campestris]
MGTSRSLCTRRAHNKLLEVENHDRDAIVIKLNINDIVIHRFFDTGSLVHDTYMETFRFLGVKQADLRNMQTSLKGFTGDSIKVEGGNHSAGRDWRFL